MGVGGGPISMQIQSRIGVTYQLQYTENLFPPVWIHADSEVGDGSDIELEDLHPDDPMRFYRVVSP